MCGCVSPHAVWQPPCWLQQSSWTWLVRKCVEGVQVDLVSDLWHLVRQPGYNSRQAKDRSALHCVSYACASWGFHTTAGATASIKQGSCGRQGHLHVAHHSGVVRGRVVPTAVTGAGPHQPTDTCQLAGAVVSTPACNCVSALQGHGQIQSTAAGATASIYQELFLLQRSAPAPAAGATASSLHLSTALCLLF